MKYFILVCLAVSSLSVLARETVADSEKGGEERSLTSSYYGVRGTSGFWSSYHYGGYYDGGQGYYGPGFYPGYYPGYYPYWPPYYYYPYYPYYPSPSPTPAPPPTTCPCGSSCLLARGGGYGVCQSDGVTCAINIQPPNCNPPSTSLTAAQCQALGGSVVGDPGDGRTSRPDYRCESNGEPILGIVVGTGAIEGAVCCGSSTPTQPQSCPYPKQYQGCGTACPVTCADPYPQFCTLQCVEGCFCPEGLYLDESTGNCVSWWQCSYYH